MHCRCLRAGADSERVADRIGELGAIERVEVELLHAVTRQLLHLLDRDARRNQAARVRIVIQPGEAVLQPFRNRWRRTGLRTAAPAGSA